MIIISHWQETRGDTNGDYFLDTWGSYRPTEKIASLTAYCVFYRTFWTFFKKVRPSKLPMHLCGNTGMYLKRGKPRPLLSLSRTFSRAVEARPYVVEPDRWRINIPTRLGVRWPPQTPWFYTLRSLSEIIDCFRGFWNFQTTFLTV